MVGLLFNSPSLLKTQQGVLDKTVSFCCAEEGLLSHVQQLTFET